MTETEHAIRIDKALLNTLLHCEMATVEIYTQVMGTFDDDLVIADLQRIRDEHRRSVRELRDHIVGLGLLLKDNLAELVDATLLVSAPAKTLGPATALALLRQDEEHGISEYEAALESDGVHPNCLRAIRSGLLPARRKHVEELDRLLGGMDT